MVSPPIGTQFSLSTVKIDADRMAKQLSFDLLLGAANRTNSALQL
jgi:hypothetical protein